MMFFLKSSLKLKVKLEQPSITGKSRKNKHKEVSSLFLIIAVWDILEDGKRTTGGHLIEFHLTESVDRKFLII